MGKKRRIWLMTGILVGIGCIAWAVLAPRHGEPTYQGRKLSWWLDGYMDAIDPPSSKMADADAKKVEIENAVRHIGTNAIPTLLEWLPAQDGPIRTKIILLTESHPWIPWHPRAASVKNMSAHFGFVMLGEKAKPALPALLEMERTAEGRSSVLVSATICECFPELATEGGTNTGVPSSSP